MYLFEERAKLKICTLSMDCIYKQVALRRIFSLLHANSGEGPTWNILSTYVKYGLLDHIVNALETGTYMGYKHFKNIVSALVFRTDWKKCQITIKLYKSLSLLNVRERPLCSMIGWLQHQHRNPLSARMCRCILNLVANTYRLGKQACRLCEVHAEDSISHILFDCDFGIEQRTVLWDKILINCPPKLADELRCMNSIQRTGFMLNGFNCNYTEEWEELYDSVCTFIYSVYNHHYESVM